MPTEVPENIRSFLELDRSSMLLHSFLARVVRQGTLRLIDGKGRSRRLGDGGMPCCTLRLAPDLREIGLMVNPTLSMAEAYMDGKITVEDGSIGDFLEIILRNYKHLEQHPIVRAARILGRQDRALQQLGISSTDKKLTPVKFPPGRARLATAPYSTGSTPLPNTIGVVEVASFIASASAIPPIVAIRSTLRPTRSAASAGS
jgi:hypothetical protein